MLILAGLLVIVLWPSPDSDVLTDLASPACKMWREGPEGFFPPEYPSLNSECFAIQALLYKRIQIRTVNDYNAYLRWSKFQIIIRILGMWAAMMTAIYMLGWSVGWIVKGFSKSA